MRINMRNSPNMYRRVNGSPSSTTGTWMPERNVRVRRSKSLAVLNFLLRHTAFEDGLPVNDEAAQVIQKIQEAIEELEGSQDPASKNDVLSQILGNEKPGRVRGYGFGMTSTRLWGSSSIHGRLSASEFVEVQGKLKELEEKMKERDVEMARLHSLGG